MFQRAALPASQAYLEITAWRMDQGRDVVADLVLLKNQASQTLSYCASEAAANSRRRQFPQGCQVRHLPRGQSHGDAGAPKIMKELAARSGWAE